MVLVVAVAPLRARRHAQGQGAAAAPDRPAAAAALHRSLEADAQGGGARPQRLVALSRRALSRVRHHLGRARRWCRPMRPTCCSPGRPTSSPSWRCSAPARFALALAGMDVGTAFGGIGSSREMMIASLAEPAMLLIVFTRRAGRRHHPAFEPSPTIFATGAVGLRVSLGLAHVRASCSWRSPRTRASRSTIRRRISS